MSDIVERLRKPAQPSETTEQWRLRHEAADALATERRRAEEWKGRCAVREANCILSEDLRCERLVSAERRAAKLAVELKHEGIIRAALQVTLTEAERKVERLVEALKFYAFDDGPLGERARAALAEAGAVPSARDTFKQQDADMMAACIDEMIHNRLLDARSKLADIRLDYGEPFSDEEVQRHLELRRHGRNVSLDREFKDG